jgi:hypothetical protein
MAKVTLAVKLALSAVALAGGFACTRNELLGTIGADGGAPAVPPRFSAPVLVTALSDPDAIDEDPTFTADALELYFMSTRAGGRDIWTARRVTAADSWQAPARVAELDSGDSDWAPAVSLDGLRIWFASDRGSVGRGQIWQATRASRASAWNPPAPVAELASGSVDFAPAVDATETTMYMSSDRASAGGTGGGAHFDLYASTRAGSGAAWGAPSAIPGVNSAEDEYDPFVAQGGLVVFFTSMRSGMGDIYWSSRRSLAEPFAPPIALGDLVSSAYDSDATLSADLGTVMFSSTRSGNAELYEAAALR